MELVWVHDHRALEAMAHRLGAAFGLRNHAASDRPSTIRASTFYNVRLSVRKFSYLHDEVLLLEGGPTGKAISFTV
jgi:hypothetical protein